MSTLLWSEELALNHPQMDATHQAFIDHLQQVDAALRAVQPPAGDAGRTQALVVCYDAMVAHTVEHFGQEDRWMLATGFAPENCHTSQHTQVLELLHEVRRRVVELQQLDWLERLLPELGRWFEQHAQSADAGLAQHLAQVGYDVDTGRMATPPDELAAATPVPAGACGP